MTATTPEALQGEGKRLFGHPAGLTFLALTEVWERFSFYGMSSLALLYMLDHLLTPAVFPTVAGLAGFRSLIEGMTGPLSDQAFASQTLGLFTGFVYFTPIFGGLLADRWLGKTATVILGALLLGFGNVAMSFDAGFLIGLLLIILGTGCLKGNISTQVGRLYGPADESRRTRAFVIFSASINAGALLGPLTCGILAARYGWHSGFMLASVLMLVALAIYIAGRKYLPADGGRTAARPAGSDATAAPLPPLTPRDYGTIAVLLCLVLFATLPLASLYQEFNVVLLFIDKSVERDLFGWVVPTSSFISLDGFFGILLVPLLVECWKLLNRAGREPSESGKIAIGCLLTASANLMMVIPAGMVDAGQTVSIAWIVLLFGLNSLGFLCYWPTLLATFSRAAPIQVNSTIMGVLFLALFLGNLLVGHLAGYWEKWSHADFFLVNAMLSFVPFLILLVVGRALDRRLASTGA
jgi:proton-dependent oligopeptide transporter, POT family